MASVGVADPMRVKSELWVQAYIRRCRSKGLAAMLVRRGQADAGAIFIQINLMDGRCDLYCPAPAGFDDADRDRRWMAAFADGPVPERDAAEHLIREASFDPDFWVVEVESPDGAHELDDRVMQN